jgi:hypothetical protein
MRALACSALIAALCTGCGTTATITRVNAPPVEAHIQGGDAENVYVEGGGAVKTIPRKDITDVDHPGDGAIVAGSILSAYGALNIAVGAPQCQEKGDAFCTGVFLPAAIGIPILIWGIATHASSVAALSTPVASNQARAMIVPIVPTDHTKPAGAGFVMSF